MTKTDWNSPDRFRDNEARDAEAYLTSDAAGISTDWTLAEAADLLVLVSTMLRRRARQMSIRYDQTDGVAADYYEARLALLGEGDALASSATAVEEAVEYLAVMRHGKEAVAAASAGDAAGRAGRVGDLARQPGYSRALPDPDEDIDPSDPLAADAAGPADKDTDG